MSMRVSTLCSAAVLGVVSIGAPQPLLASPLFELAGGVTGTAGFNARVTGAGPPATYFNPALLPRAPRSFELGVLVLSDQISLTLDGRPGGDVPLVVGDRQINDASGAPIDNSTVPTDWLESGCPISQCGEPPFGARPRQAQSSSANTRAYQVIGLVTHLIEKRLVIGFHGLIPLGEFTSADSFFNDEREQFFSNSLHPELYSDRLTATSLAFGAGVGILDNLSAGLSFTLNLKNSAVAKTYVRDPIDYDRLLLTTDVGVKASVSPHFGVAWQALEWLDFALTVHSEQKLEIETKFAAALPSGNESDTSILAVHGFMPWTVALGSEVGILRNQPHTLSAVGTLKYARWSDYLDRHGQSPGRVYGEAFAWSDTLGGTLGVRHGHRALKSFVDVTYEPSPVAPQVGRSNYVDNDRIGASVGAAYDLELFDLDFRLSAQLQGHRLIERHQKKLDHLIRDELPDDAVDASSGTPVPRAAGLQTNNPGWPGFASDGYVYGGSLAIALLY
jgi:long-chain fatty acid transport protein